MRSVLLKNLRAFCKDDDGVTLVEYGIALLVMIAVGAGAMTLLGQGVLRQVTAATAGMP